MMGAPSQWAVITIAHPGLRDVRDDCAECVELGQQAAIYARAMGSAGCAMEHIATDGGTHSATVKRVIALVTA